MRSYLYYDLYSYWLVCVLLFVQVVNSVVIKMGCCVSVFILVSLTSICDYRSWVQLIFYLYVHVSVYLYLYCCIHQNVILGVESTWQAAGWLLFDHINLICWPNIYLVNILIIDTDDYQIHKVWLPKVPIVPYNTQIGQNLSFCFPY